MLIRVGGGAGSEARAHAEGLQGGYTADASQRENPFNSSSAPGPELGTSS